MAELERQAEKMVEVESRAEVAEGERDAALDRMQLMTPRPSLSPLIELPSTLGPDGSAKFVAAVNKFRYESVRYPSGSYTMLTAECCNAGAWEKFYNMTHTIPR